MAPAVVPWPHEPLSFKHTAYVLISVAWALISMRLVINALF